jgi:hypothetical protein
MMSKIYRFKENLYIETFDEGALVLRLSDRNIFQFNLTALKVIELTNSNRDVQTVSTIIAKDFHVSKNEALLDVLDLYDQLLEQILVEEVINS